MKITRDISEMIKPHDAFLRGFAVVLVWAVILFLAVVLCGCSHMETSPTGFKMTNLNMKRVRWTPTEFTADDINASTPLNSTWRGINRETDILKDLGLALSPGTGAVPMAVKGAGILGTKFNNPPAETILTR